MTMSVSDDQLPATSSREPVAIGRFRYLRAPRPLHFPEGAQVPETRLHEALCALLRALLRHAFASQHSVGGDQFIYWDPTDPRVCLAPDCFVRLSLPDSQFRTWKVWEWGAPELAIEILSSSDDSWDSKLAKYARIGVRELVSFDPEVSPAVLRVWDRVEGDMVERELAGNAAASNVLPGFWLVVVDPNHGPVLRLSRDQAGASLFPTPAEAEAEARRTEAEALRAEADARQAVAEARIRELEAELARRGG